MNDPANPDFDYIVIGSGAGGGPVASNLAKAGFKVGLIEAGGNAEPPCYSVPVFHPFASEDADMSWEFFVRHYGDDALAKRDPKFDAARGGVFYPRAGTLGGCTAHHAMITVYGHNSDWDEIAKLTGDSSWSADNMRNYFQRLERCGYVAKPKAGQPNPTRHGFDGWLSTTGPELELVFGDKAMLQTVLKAVFGAWQAGLSGALPDLIPKDPNDWRNPKFEGVCFAPLATMKGRRAGSRELINTTRDIHPDKLIVKMNNLATKIVFDANKKAIGVECWEGEHLYRADPNASNDDDYDKRTYYCRREVILCGGAFNSPQLLMLSGIGPAAHLAQFGIPLVVDNPDVGSNLQDRYEVSVVSRMKKNWNVLKNATFKPPLPNETGDPCWRDWKDGKGVYTTNGAVLAVIKKSSEDKPNPDLFVFALPGNFHGYFRGYSDEVERTKDYLSWAILKAHTNNTAGTVRLKSNDPRDRPEINFRYFEEGNDPSREDLKAVVNGVRFVRDISRRNDSILEEVLPGPAIDTDDEIAQFVKDNAWGHHASCTNPIGKVVDGNFRVKGVTNLRIVDASVFPRIPGFFIVTPIYMIAEKASDVILADARRG
jgi:choline dehydrogenase